MQISITDEDGGLTFPLEVDEESRVDTLRALIEIETGISAAEQCLLVDMKAISPTAETVKAAGISEGCLLFVARSPASSNHSSTSSRGRTASSATSGTGSIGLVDALANSGASSTHTSFSSSDRTGRPADSRAFFDFSNIVVKDGRVSAPAPARNKAAKSTASSSLAGGAASSRLSTFTAGTTAEANSTGQARQQHPTGQLGGPSRRGGDVVADEEYLQKQAETLVNVCTADSSTMAVLLSENEALAALLPEAMEEARRLPAQEGANSAFGKLKDYLRKQLMERRKAEDARLQEVTAALADPLSARAQSFVMRQIQAEQVEDNYLLAQEHLPEAFGHVFMLYVPIEVNGVPIKAFVDSGAQGTFMSEKCAERCNLMRLLDKRYQGTALGVGHAQILGRIHLATLKIGTKFYPTSFTVLQDEKIPFLLGLDLLRRYQCAIDLKKNVLRIDDEEVSFLGEKDIEKGVFGRQGSSFFIEEVPSRTCGGNSSSSSSAQQQEKQEHRLKEKGEFDTPLSTKSQIGLLPQSNTTGSTLADEAKIQQLVDLGFFRIDAVDALKKAEGNVEAAASFLLQQQRVHRRPL